MKKANALKSICILVGNLRTGVINLYTKKSLMNQEENNRHPH